jgi:hypothetical protein
MAAPSPDRYGLSELPECRERHSKQRAAGSGMHTDHKLITKSVGDIVEGVSGPGLPLRKTYPSNLMWSLLAEAGGSNQSHALILLQMRSIIVPDPDFNHPMV